MFKYHIVFDDPEYYDWHFLLWADVEKSNQDLENLIEYCTEVCDRNEECYSPVDIMDRLVDQYDAWYWTDYEDEDLRITGWK